MVYAIVRAGGRQEKVSVGDTIVINRVSGEAGDSVELAPVLLVDGDSVTSAKSDLDKVCLLYTSPSPRDLSTSRMPSSA